MSTLAFFLLVFFVVGSFFLFIHMLMGKVIRPSNPEGDKLTIYECGEPTVGSAWVQFDLRYYVVALLFVVFDVEVAFFFPWAVVFGRANEVARTLEGSTEQVYAKLETVYQQQMRGEPEAVQLALQKELADLKDASKEDIRKKYFDKVMQVLPGTKSTPNEISSQTAKSWALAAFADILVFFAVLMVGFAYLWKRGDLNWVRTVQES